jgi:hypothetical protein
MALSGAAPDVQPAGQLGLSWTGVPSGSLLLALRVGGRLGLGARIEHAQGVAELDFVAVAVAGCAGLHFARGALAALGCGVLEPGQLSGRGRDTLNAREEPQLWLALGPAAVLAWSPVSPLVVEAGVELQIPLLRDRFLLADETVYRVPPVALRAGIGVGVRLW